MIGAKAILLMGGLLEPERGVMYEDELEVERSQGSWGVMPLFRGLLNKLPPYHAILNQLADFSLFGG